MPRKAQIEKAKKEPKFKVRRGIDVAFVGKLEVIYEDLGFVEYVLES